MRTTKRDSKLQGRKCAGDLGVAEFDVLMQRLIKQRIPEAVFKRRALVENTHRITNHWYASEPLSLTDKEVNGFYLTPSYLLELYYCFQYYSFHTTVASINFFKEKNLPVKNWTILYDGYGACSAMFATAFPDTIVNCHIPTPSHAEIASQIKAELNLHNMQICDNLTTSEGIISFEVFEHLRDPIAFITPLLHEAKYLAYAAAWGSQAMGHFNWYCNKSPKGFSRMWSKFLKDLGFKTAWEIYQVHFFNSRPTIRIKTGQEA